MSEDLKNALPGVYWKLAVAEFFCESITPLFAAIIAVLDEKDWATLSTQGKVLAVICIGAIWLDKVKPIIKDAAKRIRTGTPFDETVMISKNNINTGP